MKQTSIAFAVTAIFAGLIANPVAAENMPNIGDALRQAQPPVVPRTPAVAPPKVGGAGEAGAPPQVLSAQQPKVMVKAFLITGNRVINHSVLLSQLAGEGGKEYSLAEIEAIATRLTRFYRNRGYFVARVYVPEQEVKDGTVTLRVVEGNYGQFHLRNKSRVQDHIVQAMLDDVKDANIVSLDTLERAMLIINDTPGVRVTRADVMPGAKVGTSDFAVDTEATAAYNGFVMLDNYGSRYTGKNRLSFNLDANSPSGHGDRFSVSGLATDNSDLLNGRLAYSVSLAPNGLRGEAAVSQTKYQLGDTYSSLNAQGTAKVFDLTLTYPVRRIRAQTIETSLNVSYKDQVDEILLTATRTPKLLRSATLGLLIRDESEFLGAFGLTQGNIGLGFGSLNINEASAAALDAAGADTQGQYRKLTAGLSRMSLLPLDFALTVSLRYQQSLNGKNLDSSERMTVSGSNGVMAYPSGELIGTNASYARADLAHPLPEWGDLKSNCFLFSDWGQASEARTVASTDQLRNIRDVGIGWGGSYRNAILKVYVAHRLDDAPAISEQIPRNNFLAQAGWVF